MSLNNFMATALMAGEFELVLDEAVEILSLPQKLKYLKFPRFEMPLNNAVLIFFLNNKITADEARERLQQIIDTYTIEDSTGVIIQVNLAIFYGLSCDFSKSLDILEKLYKEISIIENLEFYYKYLVEVNFGAIQYLSGNKDSVVSLSNLQKECAARQEKYLEAHVKCLIESFAQAEEDSL